MLTIPEQKVAVKYEVKKDENQVEWKKVGTGVIEAGMINHSMKAILESNGPGNYEIRVFKEFTYIQTKFIDNKLGLKITTN